MIAQNLAVLAVALTLEAAFGYPDALFRRAGHPVTWMGALIARLDRGLNREREAAAVRRGKGVAALLVLLGAVGTAAWGMQAALPWVLTGVLVAALPAQRSLWAHVRAVAEGLERGGVEGGRAAVRMIVGRDPERLDGAGVARAAIESLAENFSDGVVAPAVWCVLLGLPGAALYKAVNTADSMIGHRTARHGAFGWAAARLDDVVNLPASRLSALWVVLAAALVPGADARGAARAVWRDAGRHRSPNAGWPEAAMAGALGVRLAGPRVYGGVMVEDAWLGEGSGAADAGAVRRALGVYRVACWVQWGVVMGGVVMVGVVWGWG